MTIVTSTVRVWDRCIAARTVVLPQVSLPFCAPSVPAIRTASMTPKQRHQPASVEGAGFPAFDARFRVCRSGVCWLPSVRGTIPDVPVCPETASCSWFPSLFALRASRQCAPHGRPRCNATTTRRPKAAFLRVFCTFFYQP
jgi:hypothetical protein